MKKRGNPTLVIIIFVIAGISSFFVVQNLMKAEQPFMASGCQGNCVQIEKNSFNPSELAIKTGEFVQFNTVDDRRHNLALGEGKEPSHDETNEKHKDDHDHVSGTESGEFGSGEAWKVQFKMPGTYLIHDHENPDLSVLVVVYDGSKK